MLKMNYSDFAKKTTTQLIKAAKKRGINPNGLIREDIIGALIANDAYYEGRANGLREMCPPKQIPVKMTEKREKYHLEDEYHGENYYLELTDSQTALYKWLEEKNIVFGDAKFEPLNCINFEAP